ncbi:sodium channel protein 1 brain-like isoform X2 [Littorina saxatilis]|uniref:sodium channel protein 1 brain-like isoform X2 n=1 Tax=Littorina saxatilis TaxID=31220 RepID=UPI0038B668D2
MENVIALAAARTEMKQQEMMNEPKEDEMPAQTRKQLYFVPFTHASYQRLLVREATDKQKDRERNARSQEAHLKDGELKFGLDEDELERRPDRNPDLEEGTSLKPEFGEPPPYYLGLPLEEVDPGIPSKSFVVLSRWLHHIHIYRFCASPSCFLLPAWNPIRRIAVYVATNQIFDFLILFTILTNCICLAIPSLNQLEWLELVFFGIYLTEMLIKIVARGLFIGQFTYLRDPWNWLDLIVIIAGVASFPAMSETLGAAESSTRQASSSTSATQALRTFRVLRAVKTISIFPGLRTIVNAMLRAIKMLLEVVLMTLFCLLVFSLVSVQLYRGSLRQKCVFNPQLLEHQTKVYEDYGYFYRRMLHDPRNWALDTNGNYMLCGNATGAGACPLNYTCQPNIGENPDYGFMNFDNVFWSALITFQLMTIDFWENAYRKVLLTNGALTVLFFIMTVFFGSFYLMNLMLAVVAITYQEEAERTNKEIESETNSKRQRKQAAATFYNMTKMAKKQSVWAKLIHENKAKEKEKDKQMETPLQKLIRVKNTINRWKKSNVPKELPVDPEYIVNFEPYATEKRTATYVAQNTKYFVKKWCDFIDRAKKREASKWAVHKERLLNVHGISLSSASGTPHIEVTATETPAKIAPWKQADKQSTSDSRPASTFGALKLKNVIEEGRKTEGLAEASTTAQDAKSPQERPGTNEGDTEKQNGPKTTKSTPHIKVTATETPAKIPLWKQADTQSTSASTPAQDAKSPQERPGTYGGDKEKQNVRTISKKEVKPDSVNKNTNMKAGENREQDNTDSPAGDNKQNDHCEGLSSRQGESCQLRRGQNDARATGFPKNEDVNTNAKNLETGAGLKDEIQALDKNTDQHLQSVLHKDSVDPRRLPTPNPKAFVLSDVVVEAHKKAVKLECELSFCNLDADSEDYELEQNARPRNWCCKIIWYRCPTLFFIMKRAVRRTRRVIRSTVADIFFDLFINFCIVVNTIIMSSEHHGQSTQLDTIISDGSVIFTVLFAMEAVLKIVGQGFRGYFASRWNRFDFLIAVISIVSIVLEKQNINGTQFLRAFRLLRVLKLAQVWPAMNSLLMIIGSALGALGQLTCILLIILYIFAIVGLQLFKEKYTEYNFPSGVPRWNFNDFFHSFMMMFRVLCGEWIEALWDCMRITEVHDSVCMLVFFPTLIFGNFIVLNLFLALLLNAFGEDENSQKDSRGTKRLHEAKKRIKNKFRWLLDCCCTHTMNVVVHKPIKDALPFEGETNPAVPTPKRSVKPPAQVPGGPRRTSSKTAKTSHTDLRKVMSGTSNALQPNESSRTSTTMYSFVQKNRRQGITMELIEVKKKQKFPQCEGAEPPSCFPDLVLFHVFGAREWFNNTTYGIYWMKLRSAVMKLVDNDIFEYGILFLILAGSATLGIEDYDYQLLPDTAPLKKITLMVNNVFASLFLAEMVLRWLAFGLTRYFTSVWTIIDFIVVMVSMTSIISKDYFDELPSIRALVALRALRPLRVISRIQGMKIVVNSLMRAIPAILNVFMVSLVFWLIFCVMGVQFFAGTFYKCIDINTEEKIDVLTKAECLATNNSYWFNSHINFDNVGNGFLALFQVATFEGWMEIMQDAVDSVGEDFQPIFENSLYTYLYFVAFIICGSFFSLNLVIGVIIDNFNALKKKYEGSYLDAFLTLNQRNYYNTLKKMSARKPQKIITPPKYRFQKIFYELSVSDRFELILMTVVFLNMIVMGAEYYKYVIPCAWREVMFMLEIAFSTFFTLEALLKIVGLRQHYFTVPWNVYDFTVAVFSFTNVAVHSYSLVVHDNQADAKAGFYEGSLLFPPTFLRLLRIFRISKVLRIIKVAKGLRKVMFSLVISLPATFNIMALLMVCLFIYAIFGMFLFHNVKLTGALTPHLNFRTLKNSALLLLSLSTAAGWNDVLDPLLIQEPFCNNTHVLLASGKWKSSEDGDCGNFWFAIPYMVSYIILTYLFIINMYIAVILENYQQAHQQEEVGVTEDDFDMFYSVWQRYDPHATQFIPYQMLSDFVADLDAPLGIEKPNEIALVSINLPILQGDRVHCLDILLALVKNVLADIEESEEMSQLKQQINTKFTTRFPSRARMNVISTTMQRKKEDVAARTLQRAWQVFKTQQEPSYGMVHLILLPTSVYLPHNRSPPLSVDI